jgi:Flp pilus assembly protein TadD
VFLNTRGVAYYRLGRFDEAVKTLTDSDQRNTTALKGSQPADVAFLAMTLHRLDRVEDAKQQLARLRELMKQDRWRADEESLGFLREAEVLITDDTTTQPSVDDSGR